MASASPETNLDERAHEIDPVTDNLEVLNSLSSYYNKAPNKQQVNDLDVNYVTTMPQKQSESRHSTMEAWRFVYNNTL